MPKTPADDPLSTDPASALVRIAFLVQSIYAKTAAAHDLTPQQAQLLCIVGDQPRAMSELVQMFRLDKSSVSGLVDRVEQRGLVTKRASDTDGRAVVVALTSEGARRGRAFRAETERQLSDVLSNIDPPQRSTLGTLLGELIRAESVPDLFGSAVRR